MSKERLEEIEYLKSRLNEAKKILFLDTEIIEKLQQQNKRYRETIEGIKRYMEYDSTIMLREEDRLEGIDRELKSFYQTKK